MIHFILFCVCVISIEVFIRSNYFSLIKSIMEFGKKAFKTISNKNISDHWKENIILFYAKEMIKSSLKVLLIILLIILIFMITDNFYSGFLAFTFSLMGMAELVFFAFTFIYLRKSF